MLLADLGIPAHHRLDILSGPRGRIEDPSQLKSNGFEFHVQNIATKLDGLKQLYNILQKHRSCIFSYIGHAIIIDQIDLCERGQPLVSIREPYHGWAVDIKAQALLDILNRETKALFITGKSSDYIESRKGQENTTLFDMLRSGLTKIRNSLFPNKKPEAD
jgi:hypothetical protein